MKGVSWVETRRRAREIDPTWDSPDRVAARDKSREQMRAEQRGHQLAALPSFDGPEDLSERMDTELFEARPR